MYLVDAIIEITKIIVCFVKEWKIAKEDSFLALRQVCSHIPSVVAGMFAHCRSISPMSVTVPKSIFLLVRRSPHSKAPILVYFCCTKSVH